jgi:hypothetical protein
MNSFNKALNYKLYKIQFFSHKMENNALWHKVSEQEKEEIKKNAKKIMDEFAAKLEKIKVEESHLDKGEGLRQEGNGWTTSESFRDPLFCNAPDSDDDYFLAEKGGWK